jgi:hypothetical protein
VDKQIVVYLHNGIPSASRRNELLIDATPWTNLTITMLSERGQAIKSSECMIQLIQKFRKFN